jgi:hypothetical protein
MPYAYRLGVVVFGLAAALAAAWTTPVNLGPTVNSSSVDASPSLGVSAGVTYLFFASDRAGGLGFVDIWYTYTTATPPNFVAPVNAGITVNSGERDGTPDICWTEGPTANTLYFYSTRPGGAGSSDIYQTFYSGGTWSTPVGVGSNVNTASVEYCVHVTSWQGQKRMYFVRDGTVHYAVYSGGQWGVPVPISLGGDAYHPYQYGEGEGARLYFSSMRVGGFGDYDIWVSTYAGGSWGAPVNLGPTVNTACAECYPWFAPDGETMYFSSDRVGGQGDLDIWSTVLDNPSVEPASFGEIRAQFR